MQNYKKYQYVVLLTPYFFILKKFKRKIHATQDLKSALQLFPS